MSRVFANGLGDRGSVPGRVIPKTQKMVLDTALLSIHPYKVRIKGKMEQSWEWSSALPLLLDVVGVEKGAFRSPSTTVTNSITFGLVFLFNGASTLVGYFMPKPALWKNRSDTI